MLKTLRRIVQEVSASENLAEALQLLVQRVRKATATQACTVFLVDEPRQEFLLVATDGLNPAAAGQIRVPVSQGLVGLVGRRGEPINLEDAPAHPDFLYRSEAGEENYRAFLGVPIIHHRRLLGVLTIQQEECRKFDDVEEAFLVTLSAQLAGFIAHAEAIGSLFELVKPRTLAATAQQLVIGLSSVPGIGIGQAVVVYPLADLDAVPDRAISSEEHESEIELLKQAIASVKGEIKAVRERLRHNVSPEEIALFDVYLRILDSKSLFKEMVTHIRAGNWAQGALRTVIQRHVMHFRQMDNTYLSERASDVRDLGIRILSNLQAQQAPTTEYPPATILIGEEVSAAALADVPEGRLVGIVSAQGSNNSHVAILARAMGVAAVMGAKHLDVQALQGKTVIIDGYQGHVLITPSPELIRDYESQIQDLKELDEELQELRLVPAETIDGYRISLYVNAGLASDAGRALSVGAEGVGLYRTEVSFMKRDTFPAEEEQRVIYRQLLKAFAPRPVIMRTLDIGGDKALPYFSIQENNPFLGWRGIRVTLDHPEVFLVQVRAMLRAAQGLKNLRIMLPMVSSVNEVDEARALIQRAYQEVQEEGIELDMPPLGVMVEVPAAVYQARELARRVDFLSIGSNDLTQYLLAVDRNNARVASLYQVMHPAVLQALKMVVDAAHAEGKVVGMCGEMASDPLCVLLLLGMGFDSLSLNSTGLLRIKWMIRAFNYAQAKALVDEVMHYDNPQAVRLRLIHALEQVGLGNLITAGKA